MKQDEATAEASLAAPALAEEVVSVDTAPVASDGLNEAAACANDATAPQLAPGAPTPATPRKPRADSKQAQLIAMLQRPEDATIEGITTAFGWQAHTVRGAIAGALKKKLGLIVISEKVEGRGRTYRIAAPSA